MTVLNRFARSANVSINDTRAASIDQTPTAGAGGQRTPSRKVDAKSMGAGIGKRVSPGAKSKIASQSPPGSRFAHFAGMTAPAPLAAELAPAEITPADAAAFVMASAAKARGQKSAAAKPPAVAAKADMSTPEGVAAFVAASAAKARGARR